MNPLKEFAENIKEHYTAIKHALDEQNYGDAKELVDDGIRAMGELSEHIEEALKKKEATEKHNVSEAERA